MSKMISLAEAAKILCVSRQSMQNYVARGLLQQHKQFNGRVFFDKDQVIELLNSRIEQAEFLNKNCKNANGFTKKDDENCKS